MVVSRTREILEEDSVADLLHPGIPESNLNHIEYLCSGLRYLTRVEGLGAKM